MWAAAAAVVALCACAAAARLWRRLRGVRVQCWFCAHATRVPYGNRNCFDCPACDQYNGFSRDGGYNKDIPAMRHESMNHQASGTAGRRPAAGQSVLCDSCARNQTLKVRQLAAFEPSCPSAEDAELNELSQRLERVYSLCGQCKRRSRAVIQQQDIQLLPSFISWQRTRRRQLPPWRRLLQPLLLLHSLLLVSGLLCCSGQLPPAAGEPLCAGSVLASLCSLCCGRLRLVQAAQSLLLLASSQRVRDRVAALLAAWAPLANSLNAFADDWRTVAWAWTPQVTWALAALHVAAFAANARAAAADRPEPPPPPPRRSADVSDDSCSSLPDAPPYPASVATASVASNGFHRRPLVKSFSIAPSVASAASAARSSARASFAAGDGIFAHRRRRSRGQSGEMEVDEEPNGSQQPQLQQHQAQLQQPYPQQQQPYMQQQQPYMQQQQPYPQQQQPYPQQQQPHLQQQQPHLQQQQPHLQQQQQQPPRPATADSAYASQQASVAEFPTRVSPPAPAPSASRLVQVLVGSCIGINVSLALHFLLLPLLQELLQLSS